VVFAFKVISVSKRGRGNKVIQSNGRFSMSLQYTPRALFLLLFLISFFLQAHNTLADEKMTINGILSHPDKYVGKKVTVEGKASKVNPRTSKEGKVYTTFKLTDKSGKGMSIYTKTHPLITEGQKVKVTGIYRKVKTIGKNTIHNVVEAWNIIRRQ
jgi:hypothetical protein